MNEKSKGAIGERHAMVDKFVDGFVTENFEKMPLFASTVDHAKTLLRTNRLAYIEYLKMREEDGEYYRREACASSLSRMVGEGGSLETKAEVFATNMSLMAADLDRMKKAAKKTNDKLYGEILWQIDQDLQQKEEPEVAEQTQ